MASNPQRLTIGVQSPEDRVAAVMATHGRTLLRVANHWSLCHDDALDAYQRALEIFLRRLDTVDRATEAAWLKVVVKHEAMAIRRSRQESVAGEEIDLDAQAPPSQRSVEEQIAGSERINRSAEALRALKPDEARALLLKAQGLSYQEIGERCGWSYTKVNRAITEGRRRFMQAYAGIESGAECARYAPTLHALANGTASSAEVVAIRPHLRHCTACRATVRELHISRLRRIRLLLPIPVLLGSLRHPLSLPDGYAEPIRPAEEILRDGGPIPESITAAPDVTAIPDSITAAPDVTAIPDSITAAPDVIDLGGPLVLPDLPDPVFAPVRHAEPFERLRPANLKHDVYSLFHRVPGSDVATGVHIATAGGGGRIASLAAVVGLCLSGVGAGTVCVVTGVLKDPFGIVSRHPAPASPRQAKAPPPAPLTTAAPRRASARLVARRPTSPAPERRRRTRQAPAVDRSQSRGPTSHEHAPISPAPTGATGDFSIEQDAGGSGAPQPAPQPATGGGEFGP